MRRNPGRFQTADQVDLYERRMREITHPLAAKSELYRRTYGNDAGIDILNAEYTDAYDKAMLGITNPRQKRLDELTDKFGNSARARNYLNLESRESFREAMLDKDEQFIRGAMREKGWSRGQAEQVYFKNLTENAKWLRIIARNNPTIAKNLIPIAKTIGKASGLPIIGAFAQNPALAAITAAIGGASFVLRNADKANEITKNWRNFENLYGKPTEKQEWNARLAGIKDPAEISQIYGELAAKFGGNPESILLSMGLGMRGKSNIEKQYLARRMGFNPQVVRLAEIYAGAKPELSDLVDAKLHSLEVEESKGWRTGSGKRATMRSLHLAIPFMKDLEARDIRPQNTLSYIFGGFIDDLKPKKWRGLIPMLKDAFGSDVHSDIANTALIDDQYRAGMFDNSVTNNETDNGKSLTVINNWGGVSVEAKDTADFADNFEAIVGNRFIGSRYVAEAFDTRRIK